MSAIGFYEPTIFLNILEILTGLLIISTVIKRFGGIEKITQGGMLILLSGIVIIGSALYSILNVPDPLFINLFDTLIFLLFSVGLLYLSKNVRFKPRFRKKGVEQKTRVKKKK
ncbi:hypothetical protein COT72_05080 [archaeon CG10_big_fil_rev_8_21_14_0_10_43_11]|nr:MAG: hypothetical protein COT72_05080 [archaeon CG10_big_fil_rev_8_21_14_0_10_43_11]